MMPKKLPNRRSIRLRGYDYSQPGFYFITICTYNGEHLFGEIGNNKMVLNDAGKIARDCWLEIPNHFPNTVLHEFVIMPNHIHGIIEITAWANSEGIDPINDYSPPTTGTSRTIGSIVRGFKIGVTVGAKKFSPLPIGQRNYHKRIIRDQTVYNRIAQYIIDNPAHRQDDCFS